MNRDLQMAGLVRAARHTPVLRHALQGSSVETASSALPRTGVARPNVVDSLQAPARRPARGAFGNPDDACRGFPENRPTVIQIPQKILINQSTDNSKKLARQLRSTSRKRPPHPWFRLLFDH
ncbi:MULTISPECIES: hypothetical protein [unclassified Xanthomonas]|uniref:hypothetical protein n=1 Tax=Xanthomonas sp. LMG 8992 TaxID=1591157 RepID=UPI00136E73B8|nr:hypothetical protein [Xanthomonas sp. LMG 8992]